jgi:hypothetical protein
METEKEKEIYEEYMSSLMDLTVNSKPLINMLTMLAEDNIDCAQVIVRAVEQHLAKVGFFQFFIDQGNCAISTETRYQFDCNILNGT